MDNLDDGEFVGGKLVTFPFVRGENRVRMKIGHRVPVEMRNRITNWMTFVNVFWDKGFQSEHVDRMADAIGFATGIDTRGFSAPELIQLLVGMRKLKPNVIVRGIYRSMRFDSHVITGLRTIFMIWKHHLEELVLRFNETRSAYIRRRKMKVPVNDVRELRKKWKIPDAKYKIGTSSLLLFYSLPPATLEPLIWVAATKWKQPAKFHWGGLPNMPEIDDFEKAAADFVYTGFCPKEPLKRIRALMKFPIAELIACIRRLGGRVNTKYDLKLPKITTPRAIAPRWTARPIPSPEKLRKKYGKADPNSLKIRWLMDEFVDQLTRNADALKSMEAANFYKVQATIDVGYQLRDMVYAHHAD